MQHTHRTQLLEFEKSLRPLFREVGLIGEISLPDDDTIEIEQTLRKLLHSIGPSRTTQFLREEAPCTLACFLVWKGIQGYHKGNYWEEVCRPVGLPQENWSQKWGEIFEDVIQRFQLADFRDLSGRRFVTPILLHGGIPASCLDDFFENIIKPAVQGKLGYGVSVDDLIDNFRDHSSLVQATNKPVRRFLENGGKVASDFVQRCLDLAFQAPSVEPLSSGEEFGLPQYVIDQFSIWQENAALQSPAHTQWRPDHYRAPQISLKLHEGCLHSSFPSQQIPRTVLSDNRELKLEVRQDGELVKSHLLYGTRMGELIETEPDEFDFSTLGEEYKVTLFAGDTPLRNWTFSGLSSDQPWLIFQGASGKLLPKQAITERDIWIVFPTSWAISTPVQAIEEASFTRELQAKRFIAEGRPSDIRFTNEHGGAVPVPVKWRDTPTLQPASTETWPRLSSGEFTVYCGSPPRLLIPRPIPDHAFLTITPTDKSYPDRKKRIRLKDLPEASPQDDYLILALDDPQLLGPNPCGRFIIQIRGRLGQDTTFRPCLFPEIKFDFPRAALLPDPNTGLQAVSFSLASPHLKGLSVEPPIEWSYDGDSYCVEVPADSDHLDVTLHMSTGEETAQVPIEIPVSRLRWAVGGLDESDALHWQDTPITIALQDLEEAQDSQEVRLLVRGDFGQDMACSFSLEGADQSQSLWLKNDSGAGRLSPFLDSLRSSGRSRNELYLEFSLPDEDSPRHIYLVQVDTTWLVEDLQIIQDFIPAEDKRTLVFRWHDRRNVKNRALRLWSLDQQLREPIEIPVKDSRSEAEFHSSLADFPHGLYRLELTILDEWAGPSSTAMPSPDANTVFDLDVREDGITLLNSPARCLEVLARLLKQIVTRRLEALSRLFNRLTDTDTDIRQQAVQALEHLGVDAVTWMIERLTDEDTAVRHHAARALGLFATHRAVCPLIRCLADKNESVRKQAVHALVGVGHPAVDPLIDGLAYDDEAVRQQAARTLVKLGVDAAARLIVGLANPDWRVRKQAAHILGIIADPRAAQPLMQCLTADNNESVRKQAVRALSRMSITVPRLIPRIQQRSDENRSGCQQAVHALGQSDNSHVLHLIERLNDEDADGSEQAAHALGQLGDPRAIASLRFFLDAPNRMTWRVRQAAKQTLAKLETNLAAEERSKRNDP